MNREYAIKYEVSIYSTAIGINSANCLAKGVAFVFTGSHAMYSEMIHSAADTMNQIGES